MKKRMIYLLMFALALSVIQCHKIVDVDEKPLDVERKTTLKIKLKDITGYMQQLYGNDGVRGAEVMIKSNTLGLEYNLISDDNGIISIEGIISDVYLIAANRTMTQDEMEQLTGVRTENIKLVNTKAGIVNLQADVHTPVEISMDIVLSGSALVISEMYACGPPDAGLYWHDKYFEVYNQSDSIIYLDGIIAAVVYYNANLGFSYIDDPVYVHSRNVWMFPGEGEEYPIYPGQFVVVATDAIDHRINAPNSVDLSNADFEFYKDDAPDIDNPNIPNMIKLYQSSGNDWLIGGERGALILAKIHSDSIGWIDDRMIIPYSHVIDGMEYLKDPTQLDRKTLNHIIDRGTTGGITFYSGKSMERILIQQGDRNILKDDNNSSLDFRVIDRPTPGYHHQLQP